MLREVVEFNSQNEAHRTSCSNLLFTATSPENILLILQNNANINIQDEKKRTPLFTAFKTDIVQTLLENRADPNIQDDFGNTRLFTAHNEPAITSLLLKHKADPNIRNNTGWTPLHSACTNSSRLLLDHNADVNAMDNGGKTPLFRTTSMSKIRLLLEYGANPFPQTPQEESQLENIPYFRNIIEHFQNIKPINILVKPAR